MPFFLKEKNSDKFEFYGTLPRLLEDYPHLKIDTVKHYTSRLKKPYQDDQVEIYYRGQKDVK